MNRKLYTAFQSLVVVQNFTRDIDGSMGVASNRQEEAIASFGINQIKNVQADQLCSLQKTKRRQTGI